ncbi:extensin family protein [Acetobacteraceae bacterium H6797]|nr:extensin family protein [Acetobacteraceae bacterium H6797]
MRRLILLLLLAAPLLGVGGYMAGWWKPPPEWDPMAPLDIRAEPNIVTRLKIHRLNNQPSLCQAVFEASGMTADRLPDRPSAEACPLSNVLRLKGETVSFSPNRPMVTCPLAVAFLMFERHSLQPAAQAHFGQRVERVRHLGSYACRNVYGRENARRSQHATANALDVQGFTLANGRDIALPRDWGSGENGAFLADVRDGACRWFSAVLGPDYNAAHRDHFHLDRGWWRRCS